MSRVENMDEVLAELEAEQAEAGQAPAPCREALRAKLEACNRALLEALGDLDNMMGDPAHLSDRYAQLHLAGSLNALALARLVLRRRRRRRAPSVAPSEEK